MKDSTTADAGHHEHETRAAGRPNAVGPHFHGVTDRGRLALPAAMVLSGIVSVQAGAGIAVRLLHEIPNLALACPAGFSNGPDRPLDLSLHSWTILERGQEWDRAAKALYTTREDRIAEGIRRARERKRKERIRAWRQEEEIRLAAGKRHRNTSAASLPRLTSEEKASVRSQVRAFTILDYLYRPRLGRCGVRNSHAAHRGRYPCSFTSCGLVSSSARDGCSTKQIWLQRNVARSAAHGLATRRQLLANA